MTIKTSQDLFEHMLQDMCYAEKEIIKALTKMEKAASDSKLKKAFKGHIEETETHVERLESVLEMLDLEVKDEKCEAIIGLIEEGEELMKETPEGPLRDAALIAAAQKVEHYEIATYGTLCAMAKESGFNDAADILQETLEEEKATDEKLVKIAEGGVNKEAVRMAA